MHYMYIYARIIEEDLETTDLLKKKQDYNLAFVICDFLTL